MRLSVGETQALAARAIEAVTADQAEALVVVESSALTRFADSRIHQNVFEDNASLSIRAVAGTQVGVASTNRLDEEGVHACAKAASEAARHAPADATFPGLPKPQPLETPDRRTDLAATFGAEARAQAVSEIVEQSVVRGLSAAGMVSTTDSLVAVSNTLGVRAAMPLSTVRATVLSSGEKSGSGWASFVGRDSSTLAAAALGDHAATLAERSVEPVPLEPGTYTVILAQEAVADLVSMLAYAGLSAKSVAEGRSFMSGHVGERLMSSLVSIVDDATAEDALGLTFDFEGMPKRRVALIDTGVAAQPVTDSYWAARTDAENTGHALPAPNTHGPLPLDLRMAPGTHSIDELVAGVEHGIYVTRFHYVNIEDPVKTILTGMTRDGTFLIEKGRLASPVRNLRFTQGAQAALDSVVAVGSELQHVGDFLGATLVPPLLIERFDITGQTAD